jgi:hypothetical protein
MEPVNMKSSVATRRVCPFGTSIGTFALRLAATAVLYAPAATAQAQGIGQSIL